jgi:hypothetical protein
MPDLETVRRRLASKPRRARYLLQLIGTDYLAILCEIAADGWPIRTASGWDRGRQWQYYWIQPIRRGAAWRRAWDALSIDPEKARTMKTNP